MTENKIFKQGRCAPFTWNNYTDEQYNYLCEMDKEEIRYIIIGKEISESGTPHLQGYVEFYDKKYLVAAKKLLDPENGKNSKIHLETPNPEKTRIARINYCKKDDENFFEYEGRKRKQGKRTDWDDIKDMIDEGKGPNEIMNLFPEQYAKCHSGIEKMIEIKTQHNSNEILKEHYNNIQLRPWQFETVTSVNEPCPQNNRKITWIFDEGNTGKSFLCTYLAINYNALCLEGGKKQDLACAYKGQPIVCFDFTRSSQEFVNYDAIEAIVNGKIFSSKYNSGCKIYPKPWVLCFANWLPKINTMTKDRWNIFTINSHMSLELYDTNVKPIKNNRDDFI